MLLSNTPKTTKLIILSNELRNFSNKLSILSNTLSILSIIVHAILVHAIIVRQTFFLYYDCIINILFIYSSYITV